MRTLFASTVAAAGLALSVLAIASPSQAAHYRKHLLSGTAQAEPVQTSPGPVMDTDSSDPSMAQAAAYGRMIWPQNGSYRAPVTQAEAAPSPAVPERRFLSGSVAPTSGAVMDTDSSDPSMAQAAAYGRMIWPQKGVNAW